MIVLQKEINQKSKTGNAESLPFLAEWQEGLIEELTFRGKGVPGGGQSKYKGPAVSISFSEEQTICVCVLE